VVPLPVQKPTSCMFGGPDLSTLYVTSAICDLTPDQLAHQPQAGGLLAVDVGVRGVPEPRFAG
jgi:sugar lactone lactonase YvrE